MKAGGGGRRWGIIKQRSVGEGEDDIDDEWKTVRTGELFGAAH